MNKEAQEYLNSILALEPNCLNDSQVEFIKARVSYLSTEQKEKFGSIFGTAPKQIPYKELKEIATKLGIKKVTGVSREKLEQFIADHN